MYYIVQENLFKEEGFHHLMDIFARYNIDYEIVKFIPFTHEMEFKTDRKDVFIFGSVNMAKVANKYEFWPGSLYNENHDFTVYAYHYGDNMLNADGKVIKFGQPIPFDNYIFFARPTKDTKVFSGQLFTQDSWKEYVAECIKNNLTAHINEETEILVAPLKQTQQEVRCWVINGKVVTTSRYKLGERVITENYDHESGYWEFAQSMADIYCPAECFVIDVCLIDGEYKVVEINCFNCSGFYKGDMYKIITSLENFYNDK